MTRSAANPVNRKHSLFILEIIAWIELLAIIALLLFMRQARVAQAPCATAAAAEGANGDAASGPSPAGSSRRCEAAARGRDARAESPTPPTVRNAALDANVAGGGIFIRKVPLDKRGIPPYPNARPGSIASIDAGYPELGTGSDRARVSQTDDGLDTVVVWYTAHLPSSWAMRRIPSRDADIVSWTSPGSDGERMATILFQPRGRVVYIIGQIKAQPPDSGRSSSS